MKICIFFLFCILSVVISEDYYELLGISKDADNREIRKAFKKLALKLHPDKTQGKDENAHDKFIIINKAYEVLKDENTRKKYDLYGEEGLKEDFGSTWKGNYHSWNYYSESFGIYDDDPEIITLNKHDFVQSVLESTDLWFVNFYSPQCSHCHHLASAWRELARELQDVIHIGAVNCEEDWMLCRQQNIHSYPSLVLYPQRERYRDSRDVESMLEYILNILPNKVIKLRYDDYPEVISKSQHSSKPWLIFACNELKDCLDQNDMKKLGKILDNLINVAEVDKHSDTKICEKLNCNYYISYYPNLNSSSLSDELVLDSTNIELRSLIKMIYVFLPGAVTLSDETFKNIRDPKSTDKSSIPWLLQFSKVKTRSSEMDIELKRLQALLLGVSVGYFDCEKYSTTCSSLYIKKFPTFILFKPGGAYEFYHGRTSIYDVARFTREVSSSKVQTLTPDAFPEVIESHEIWFIDFFAPWCPPCMELLPQWRKASQTSGHLVKFATVDCSTHVTLCRKYNINSYPTTILYNQSTPHRYSGAHSQNQIEDFVEDILRPTVISLSPATFKSLVHAKTRSEIWVVDFFAPWCGPCQQLAPQWRKLAKMLRDISYVRVGQVDCQTHHSLCDSMGINSYPTIHLYPRHSVGINKIFTYNGRNRDAASLQGWIYDFLPSKVQAITSSSYKSVLSDKTPWVIDFFAPWCTHCQIFAPEFEKLSQTVDGKVKLGKINCDQYPELCRMAGVRAYPTVLYYEGNKGHATQNPIGAEIETLTFNGIYSFLEDRLGVLKHQKKAVKDEL